MMLALTPVLAARPALPLHPASVTPRTRGETFPVSLADAIFIGLRNNHDVKSAYIDRAAQRFSLYVEETRFRPTATLSGQTLLGRDDGARSRSYTLTPTASWLIPTGAEFSFSWARSETYSGGDVTGSDTATLSLTQPLLKGAGIDVNMEPVRYARLQEKINKLSLKSSVSTVVTNIITAYRTLISAQDTVKLTRESLSRTEDILHTNQQLIKAGRMAASEIVQTQANLASEKVSALQAQQNRNSAQLALLNLLAMDLHINIVASDRLNPRQVDIDGEEAVRLALENRADYLSQKLTVEKAKQKLIVEKNNRLWDFSLIGNLEYSRYHNPVTNAQTSYYTKHEKSGYIGFELTIPIGDTSLEEAEAEAEGTLQSAENELAAEHKDVEADVRDAVQEVDLAWQQYIAASKAQALALKAVKLEREKLKIGRASNFEVLTYESNLSSANSEMLSASITYLNALTSLDDQLGTTLETWKISLND